MIEARDYFLDVVYGKNLRDDEVSDPYWVKAAGLADGASRESATVRCDLYRRYFSKHL